MRAPFVGPIRHARRRTEVGASSRGLVLTDASTDGITNFPGRPENTAVDHALPDHQTERSLAADADSPHVELPQINTQLTYGLWELQRVTPTTAGHTRCEQLSVTPPRTNSWVPDPQFPHKTPAGRRSSSCPAPLPAPGGQPDPNPQATGSSGEQLRWARCPDDDHLHLLAPADVVLGAGGHAQAVCGQRIPAEVLTITRGPAGALCMSCVIGATSPMRDPRPKGTS